MCLSLTLTPVTNTVTMGPGRCGDRRVTGGARLRRFCGGSRSSGPAVTVEVVCWSVVRGLGCCSVVVVSEMASVDVNECRHGGVFGGQHNDGEEQDPGPPGGDI